MPQSALAAAGLLFVMLVIAGVIYFVSQLVKPKPVQKIPEDAPAEKEPDPLEGLRACYDALYISLEVPDNPMTVSLASNGRSAFGAPLRHYCWVNGDIMILLPIWESLIGENGELVPLDMRLTEWRIPVDNIICYVTEQGLTNKFVVLQVKSGSEVINLAFDDDAVKVFAMLFPEKDFTNLLEELYPKSSRNIRDIRETFQSLKELREEDLITEDEYAAKKKEMLILM